MAPERPAYELAFEPDDTSWSARENLADVLRRELLGPADGDEEVLETPPDTRYLVGRIAPTRLTDGGDKPQSAEQSAAGDDGVDLGDDIDARESRGVPVGDVDDTTVDAEDDGAEDAPVRRGLMIPASMGLRFQVPLDLGAVTVIASWGTYGPESTGETLPSGRSKRVFRRTPVDIPVRVHLTTQTEGTTGEYPLKDDVLLRVDTYADAALGRRIVEVALCNDKETPRKIPINAWLFQTALHVEADGDPVFLPVHDPLLDPPRETDDSELRRLDLQYRDRLEFAIGRTCSADWLVDEGSRRARRVSTTWLPVTETPQTRAIDPDGVVLDMRALAAASPAEVDAGLRPIVKGYADWLEDKRAEAVDLPTHLRTEAEEAIEEADYVHTQLSTGLDFLVGDEEAMRCFAFMNRVMADQRVHSQIAEERAKDPSLTADEAEARVLDHELNAYPHSWRTFQIAFILMQLPGLCRPDHPRRSGDSVAQVELLFFPTGGGKTEAYLGLAAFAFAIRRRQGVIESPDGLLDGGAGVTVLMRYTLRLLTAQQFQRATTLVCAAELARREDPQTWGAEPFRIGLWVGTDVSPKRVSEAAEQLAKINEGRGHRLTVLQIQRCPWCGTPIGPRSVHVDSTAGRVYVRCGDDLARCPFSPGGAVDEGLPVLTVDEEIYRLAPAFVIATVDKFARLAREGEAASLFGYVSRRCDRHGFVHTDYSGCEIKDGSKHPAKNGMPAVAVHPHQRLRPPDLIIQDELHLITGALGTTVGLFEVAIDALTTWRTASGATAKPLIVASTATVRNAADQVKSLYGRGVLLFPPRVLDAGDTYFSKEVPVTRDTPGRRYVGVSTTGVRLTSAEIRVAEVLMSGAQLVLDRCGLVADPYMTLVGYFNATRELAGMARYMQDDVQTALSKGRPSIGLLRRTGTAFGSLNMDELTSRVSGAGITDTLDKMAARFDPGFDSTEGRRARREALDRGETPPKRDVNPYDVILATSMLQVGVDVTRLGLMVMVGQPKNTAEYIQASSRVGRDESRPGLVVTLGNWARPRDLAHFEQFRHYHETFYAQVEPLSVTPFSVTSLERGLDGVLVSASRVLEATTLNGLSPEKSAGRIAEQHAVIQRLIDGLVGRALAASDEESANLTRTRLVNRLDQWEKRRTALIDQGKGLAYERIKDPSTHGPLMRSAENVQPKGEVIDEAPFVVANSMREVQPEINLLVSPDPKKLNWVKPVSAPDWAPSSSGATS